LADHYVAGSRRGTDAPWFVVAAARSRPGSRATYLVCHKLPAGDGRISGLAGCWDSRLRDWAATCRCRYEALASGRLTLGTILAALVPESWASMCRAGNGPARADAKGSPACGVPHPPRRAVGARSGWHPRSARAYLFVLVGCCGSGGAVPGWLKWPRCRMHWAFSWRALVGAEACGQSPLCWPGAGPGRPLGAGG
jgi:hypothetical protein